jgi:hypothetical protein
VAPNPSQAQLSAFTFIASCFVGFGSEKCILFFSHFPVTAVSALLPLFWKGNGFHGYQALIPILLVEDGVMLKKAVLPTFRRLFNIIVVYIMLSCGTK